MYRLTEGIARFRENLTNLHPSLRIKGDLPMHLTKHLYQKHKSIHFESIKVVHLNKSNSI